VQNTTPWIQSDGRAEQCKMVATCTALMETTYHVGRSKSIYEWCNSIYKGVDNGKNVVFLMLRIFSYTFWQIVCHKNAAHLSFKKCRNAIQNDSLNLKKNMSSIADLATSEK
jgi:hypothetical protein